MSRYWNNLKGKVSLSSIRRANKSMHIDRNFDSEKFINRSETNGDITIVIKNGALAEKIILSRERINSAYIRAIQDVTKL